METKECRHCKQPIHKDARRCQHCQGMQGWIADQRDPRMAALILVPMLLILGLVVMLPRWVTKPIERQEIGRASVLIKNVRYRFGTDARSGRIFVYGEIENTSGTDAGQTCLRANLYDRENKITDSFVQKLDSSGVAAHETKRFRIAGETPVRPEEIRKTEVVVDRVTSRGRWD